MKGSSFPGIRRTLHLGRTVSTQTRARLMAEQGAPAWTLVWADKQTRGKGRIGRKWSSGTGGLYFSLIVRPKIPPSKLADLSLDSAHCCAKVLGRLSGLRMAIKHPNDVFAQSKHNPKEARKVCGILIEASEFSTPPCWAS